MRLTYNNPQKPLSNLLICSRSQPHGLGLGPTNRRLAPGPFGYALHLGLYCTALSVSPEDIKQRSSTCLARFAALTSIYPIPILKRTPDRACRCQFRTFQFSMTSISARLSQRYRTVFRLHPGCKAHPIGCSGQSRREMAPILFGSA